MKLESVVKGQVAELFGRFRTATALSPDEKNAIALERQEYAANLAGALEAIEGVPEARVVDELRRVIGELRNDVSLVRLPSIEDLVRKVRTGAMATVQKPYCPACERFGAPAHAAGEGHGRRPALRGELPVERLGEWWCHTHYAVLAWYLSRQRAHADGKPFRYPPPAEVLPPRLLQTERDPRALLEYTDGALQVDYVVYVREVVERMTSQAVLTEPRA